jgi:hypothetical protein
MKKFARELIFISQINRDGKGVSEIPDDYLKAILENKLMKDEPFKLKCLSMTEKTYIVFNFNAFVVKLKEE